MATYDPLTGASLPELERTDSPPPGPYTGDSGYDYGSAVFDLLRTGTARLVDNLTGKLENKQRVELGRQGLTATGQPQGVTLGGMSIPPGLILAGVGIVALAIILHGKR